MQYKDETIIDSLKLYYPFIADNIASWSQVNDFTINIILNDGSEVEYNRLLNSLRAIIPYDGSQDSWKREFSYRLMNMMQIRGFDQAYLSERSGISQVSISNYINRRYIPSAHVVYKIANALGCDSSYLIDFEK